MSRPCGQQCGQIATVYAMDPLPGGWGGYYCEPCTQALGFQITDRIAPCSCGAGNVGWGNHASDCPVAVRGRLNHAGI